ncbi:YolD-like family protein [Bacillus sp. B1-b2]|nr:YolD-like family protein [Bacillus sp. B1-b2]
MLNELKKDYYRQAKPILDEYQIEEIASKISYAMEFTFLMKIKLGKMDLNGIMKGWYID